MDDVILSYRVVKVCHVVVDRGCWILVAPEVWQLGDFLDGFGESFVLVRLSDGRRHRQDSLVRRLGPSVLFVRLRLSDFVRSVFVPRSRVTANSKKVEF